MMPRISISWMTALGCRVIHRILSLVSVDLFSQRRIQSRSDLEKLGESEYGSWVVPRDLFNSKSICYLAGVGTDISFDLALIEKFGCLCHAFDPTPESIKYIERQSLPSQYRFHAFGLWSRNEKLKFYAPANELHISHSILNLQGTENYFEANCRTVASIMEELGDDQIDLIKLDIEGAEYEVLESMKRDGIAPQVILIEYDETGSPLSLGWYKRIRQSLQAWLDDGYRVVHHEPFGNLTLVRGEECF